MRYTPHYIVWSSFAIGHDKVKLLSIFGPHQMVITTNAYARRDAPEADEMLAIRCQLAEAEAFATLIQRWHPSLCRYTCRAVNSEDAAREGLQDVWLGVVRAMPRLREPRLLSSWLVSIAEDAIKARRAQQPHGPGEVLSPSHDCDTLQESTARDAHRLVARELSLTARLNSAVLLFLGLAFATVTSALFVAELYVAPFNRMGLLALTGMGLSWTILAAWILARRHVLFVTHTVVAARLGIEFMTIFTLGAVAVALTSGGRQAGLFAAAVGLMTIVLAALVYARATRRRARLSKRLVELNQTFGG